MALEDLYEFARRREQARQPFIDLIPLGEIAKYIWKVQYVPKPVDEDYFSLTITSMRAKPSFAAMRGYNYTKSFILVYPHAFTQGFNIFISNLLDHEGAHAKDIYERSSEIFKGFPQELYTPLREGVSSIRHSIPREVKINIAMIEIKAFQNQLIQAGYRGLSKERIEFLRNRRNENNALINSLQTFKSPNA